LTELHHAPVAFGLIVGERNSGIVKEAQRVLFARAPSRTASAPPTTVTLRLTCRLGTDETALSGSWVAAAAMFVCASVAIAQDARIRADNPGTHRGPAWNRKLTKH
jgi:hypothetical protein